MAKKTEAAIKKDRRDPVTGMTKAEMEADIARRLEHIDRMLDERELRTRQLLETVSRTGG